MNLCEKIISIEDSIHLQRNRGQIYQYSGRQFEVKIFDIANIFLNVRKNIIYQEKVTV